MNYANIGPCLDSLARLNEFLYSSNLDEEAIVQGERILQSGHEVAEEVFWATSASAFTRLEGWATLAAQFVTDPQLTNMTGESTNDKA